MSTPTAARTPLIGLGGLARSGKDTLADYLHKHYGYAPAVGMSDPLITAMRLLDPLIALNGMPSAAFRQVQAADFQRTTPPMYAYATDLLDALGYTDAKEIPAFRDWLRTFGTEVGRMFDADTWVRVAGRTVHELRTAVHVQGWDEDAEGTTIPAWGGVTLTGIRYPNEAAAIRDAGGLLVYVSRAGLEQHGHTSENSLHAGDFDIAVDNNGTLDDLYRQAAIIAQAARLVNR